MSVYVINKNGNPLMPCSDTKAHHLLDEGKAKVIKTNPFTIRLLWDCEENVQEVVAGMDTGSKTIGCAAIGNGIVLYQSEIQIRTNVSKKMKQRRVYRRTRRGKLRYRKPRFSNRANSKKENRLAPSIKSKIDSHLREKNFIKSILPVSKWKVETASFDIHKITNPDVQGINYQNGQQKRFYNVKAFVLNRDNYTCQKCKAKNTKLQVHHILYKSQRGTDTPSNLITLCSNCHDKVHNNEFVIKGIKSKTKYATEMGIIKSQIKKQFGEFEETYGYETKFKREQFLHLPKTHFNDAITICCEEGETVDLSNIVYYKKHVSKGDYKQTMGAHSHIRIPTGKLFGLRKFDKIKTSKGIGFVKGKVSRGYFNMMDIFGNPFYGGSVKKDCTRLTARSTTLIENRKNKW